MDRRATLLLCALFGCGDDDASDPPDADIDAAAGSGCALALYDEPRDIERLHLENGAELHPYGFIGDPTVLYEDGTFRMWFTSSSRDADCEHEEFWQCLTQGFGYAESEDGITFSDEDLSEETPGTHARLVFGPNEAGWDRVGTETAFVVRDDDGLRLWYDGHRREEGPFWDAIGLATSVDGIDWTRVGDEPVLAPEEEWESVCSDPPACGMRFGGLMEPSVIYEEGTYTMWYAGYGLREYEGENGEPAFDGLFRIGRAVSSDGQRWTRDPEPVFEPRDRDSETFDDMTVSHVNVIRTAEHDFHMFYHGSSRADEVLCNTFPEDEGCATVTPGSIGYAHSDDGITWERNDDPLLSRHASDWHDFFVGGPSVVIVDGVAYLYFFGAESLETSRASHFVFGRAVIGECD